MGKHRNSVINIMAVRHAYLTKLLISTAICMAPATLRAQTQSADQSNSSAQPNDTTDIVVTASRTNQSSQKVPIPLTAVGGEQLAKQNITSSSQLSQLAPSLLVNDAVSSGSTRFSIRGISNNDTLPAASSAVATYIDDVYQASLFGTSSALYDVQRVEVLRGPQGTTFGRNTTGGAVAYFSQTPTNEAEGYLTARVGGGDQAKRFLEGVLNVPVIDDVLAIRFSARVDSKSNFYRDIANDVRRGESDGQAGRFQVQWKPSADTKVNLYLYGARQRGEAPTGYAEVTPDNVFAIFGVAAQSLPNFSVSQNNHRYYDNFDNYGATLRVEQQLGDLFSLTSITHYRETTFETAQDLDATPQELIYYISRTKAEQYGQEFRIASDATRPISGILGVYYEHDKSLEHTTNAATEPQLDYFGIPVEYNERARYLTKTEAYAAFLNVTVRPTEQLAITGGIRKSYERRTQEGYKEFFNSTGFDWTDGNLFTANPTPSDLLDYRNSIKVTPWSWDATINYTPTNDILAFARIGKGYRSGGFNPAKTLFFPRIFGEAPPTAPAPFGAETIQSYELGIKSTFLGGRLRVNAGVFHYDYSDQQVTTYPAGVPTTTNAGTSRVNGGELEIVARPVSALELRGSAAFTDAKYKRFLDPSIGADYSGNQLIQAPKWTLNGSATYTLPVSSTHDLVANTTWSYRTETFYDPANTATFRSPPAALGSARISFNPSNGKGVSVAVFVDNILDRKYTGNGFSYGSGFNLKYFAVGRTFGGDISFRF